MPCILEALCQELAQFKGDSGDHSAKRQTLANRLEREEKKQTGLKRSLQMLEKEMELMAQAETDKLQATEVGEALCQKISFSLIKKYEIS